MCTRCLGMIAGILLGFLKPDILAGVLLVWKIIFILFLTLPAAIDFTVRELLASYRSSNFIRFITGVLFGLAGAYCLAQARTGSVGILIGFLIYLALVQVVIVKIFQIHGHADAYLERYAQAAYTNNMDDAKK